MSSRILLPLLVGLVFFLPVSVTRAAESLDAVKARMTERLPAIDALKASGDIGENNQALLEVRSSTNPRTAELVTAENADRTRVYAELARQAGTTPEVVAKARARQIAASSATGVWLQREDGSWYRK